MMSTKKWLTALVVLFVMAAACNLPSAAQTATATGPLLEETGDESQEVAVSPAPE